MAIVWSQKVEVEWNPANREYYEGILNSNGGLKYEFTRYRDKFLVDVGDVNKHSRTLIKCICDRCNKVYDAMFYQTSKAKNNYCSKACKNNTQVHECNNCGKDKKISLYRKQALLSGEQKNFFCSRKCQGEWKSKNKSGKDSPFYDQYETSCEYCGKEYTIPANQLGRNKYCSVGCRQKDSRKRIELNCDYCDKKIYKTPFQLTKTKNYFCSHDCADAYRSEQAYENRECEYCFEEYKTKKVSSQRFCSIKCQSKWQSEYLVGERANNFRVELPLSKRNIRCDWCEEKFNARSPYQYRMVKSGKQQNVFCSTKCRQSWYSNVFSQSEEWRNKSRIDAVKILESGVIKSTATECQLMVNTILDNLGIRFENEYNCKYYSMDNYLLDYNLMIEVMGTFWHCDPRVYGAIEYEQQLSGVIRDKRKKGYIKKNYDIDILYLWEKDIFEHPEVIEELISLYIDNKGKLSDYHSFNYFTHDKEIYLTDKILTPYMDYSNEDRGQLIDVKVKEKVSKKQVEKWMTFNCDNCNKEKEILISRYNKSKKHYCSRECVYEYRGSKV